jgi:hypothetical protein
MAWVAPTALDPVLGSALWCDDGSGFADEYSLEKLILWLHELHLIPWRP